MFQSKSPVGPSYREAKGGTFDFLSSQTPGVHHHRHRAAHRRQWNRPVCVRAEVRPFPRRRPLEAGKPHWL